MAIKSIELVSGCIAKAADNEPVFVLRGQDRLSPMIVREWARMAEESNRVPAAKIAEAYALAEQMEAWPTRKYPD